MFSYKRVGILLSIITLVLLFPKNQEYKGSDMEMEMEREYLLKMRSEDQYKMRRFTFDDSMKQDGVLQPSKIVIVSSCDKVVNQTMHDQVLENRRTYAARHGYQFQFINSTEFRIKSDAPTWDKVPVMRKAFELHPDAEWYWWLDMDALIMNYNIDLASHLLHPIALEQRLVYNRPLRDEHYQFARRTPPRQDIDKIDMILSQDGLGWNSGSMFFKNTLFTRYLLDIWDDGVFRDMEWWQNEQSVFCYLATRHPLWLDHIGTVPQGLINSYYDQEWKYVHGELVCHFAGLIKQEPEFGDYWTTAHNAIIQ